MTDPIFKLLQTTAFLTLGIAPIDSTIHDFNRVLATLPPDEARKMRRKFRKLWRSFAKRPKKGTSKAYIAQLGLGEKDPTRAQKRYRKSEVLRRVNADVVGPMQIALNKTPENREED
jgi:hypothetical protein